MKTRKLFVTVCVSSLIVGLFGGCAKDEVTPATVFYSAWIDYAQSKTTNTFIPAPEITQNVLDRGIVLVYKSDSRTTPVTVIQLLPQSQQLGATSPIDYAVYLGKIALFTTSTFSYKFRYVVITGGMPGARKAAIDYSDYEAVKKAYNIAD